MQHARAYVQSNTVCIAPYTHILCVASANAIALRKGNTFELETPKNASKLHTIMTKNELISLERHVNSSEIPFLFLFLLIELMLFKVNMPAIWNWNGLTRMMFVEICRIWSEQMSGSARLSNRKHTIALLHYYQCQYICRIPIRSNHSIEQ